MEEHSDHFCIVCLHIKDKMAEEQELARVHIVYDNRLVLCSSCFNRLNKRKLTNDDLVLACSHCVGTYLLNTMLGQEIEDPIPH